MKAARAMMMEAAARANNDLVLEVLDPPCWPNEHDGPPLLSHHDRLDDATPGFIMEVIEAPWRLVAGAWLLANNAFVALTESQKEGLP